MVQRAGRDRARQGLRAMIAPMREAANDPESVNEILGSAVTFPGPAYGANGAQVPDSRGMYPYGG